MRAKQASKRAPSKPRTPKPTRFAEGTIYRGDGVKKVCVRRLGEGANTRLWMVDIHDHRANMHPKTEADIFLGYDDECEVKEIYAVRVIRGIEYASDEDAVRDLDAETQPQRGADGRYDFDEVREISPDEYEFCAARTAGTITLTPEPPLSTRERKRKARRQNRADIASCVIMAVIIAFVLRACMGIGG